MPTLIILLGVALLALGFWSQRRVNAMKKASLSWPTTSGTITAATLENRESGTAESGKTQFTVFCADYTYSVNGVAQKGHWESGKDKRFVELQAKYAAGSRVMVHYDPKKPGHATLEPTLKGSSSIALLGFIFGTIAVFIGGMLFLVK